MEENSSQSNKYDAALAKYNTNLSDADIQARVADLIEKKVPENNTEEVKKLLFNCIDLTTLNSTDSDESVMHFTEKVNEFDNEFPDMKNVAAICVYPNFADIVKNTLQVDGINIACVSGGFPSSQTFIEVKVAETALAIADGADEIDIVISIGKFLSGDYETMCEEIQELKEVCKERHLKVILETGALKTASNIKKASILSMYSGADFIKTSTGKQQPAATPEAAYVMCEAIKEYYQKTNNKIGFKPAGGINTVHDAIIYCERNIRRRMAEQPIVPSGYQSFGQFASLRYQGRRDQILLRNYISNQVCRTALHLPFLWKEARYFLYNKN